MITRQLKPVLVLGISLILTLTACGASSTQLNEETPTQVSTKTTQPLATPYAQEPAAGICASFEGEMVTVSLNADIPDPRCSKVRADQKLTLVNQTQVTLQVSIGNFNASLEPGEKVIIDKPFGDYLAPGVHQLQVSPCCGAELWLEGK